ncbi:MAG TPA: hypothetical protein VN625_10990 [Desulfuromonadaceae bacterium]|nr:hypothetical protein [Desulfuromonadaceae bacterium]
MKTIASFLVALFLAVTVSAQSDVVARVHFLGGDRISTDPSSRAFTNEFTSPEARALENQTLDKLTKTFAADFKGDAAQLRPLLDDLLSAEWTLVIRDAGGSPQYTLAMRLRDERAQLWKKNFAGIGVPFTVETGSNHWTTVNWAKTRNTPVEIAVSGMETNWLDVDLGWPRLAQLFPALREFDFPKIAFQVIGRGGNFEFAGKLNLSQPLPSLEPWRVPTNSIHAPFISFTAGRGMGAWLQKQSWFQPYELQPQADQFFIWAMPRVANQSFVAEPVPNAEAALTQLYQNLSANNAWQSRFSSPVVLTLTNNMVSIGGFPFMSANVRAVHMPGSDFLVGGFFPNIARGQPLPRELFDRLNTPKLVYYHWELTEERLKELPQLSQLLLMVTSHRQLDGQSASRKWLERIEPGLGNCLTIATEASPTEIDFTRKAPAGLTAVELTALASWLESPNFPANDLRLPPRGAGRLHRPNLPMPAPPNP